jgi:hypothetical protein
MIQDQPSRDCQPNRATRMRARDISSWHPTHVTCKAIVGPLLHAKINQ